MPTTAPSALIVVDLQRAIDDPTRRRSEHCASTPLAGERVINKSANSAFIGTPLERELRDAGIEEVVITGVITNNSVEATARMSGNLGFRSG